MAKTDPSFGVEPRVSRIVEDHRGTQTVAHYDEGTWWEGHFEEDRTRVQVHPAPCKLAKVGAV